MREAQFTRGGRKRFNACKWKNSMSLMQSRIDDRPHNLDGLRLYAQDGLARRDIRERDPRVGAAVSLFISW